MKREFKLEKGGVVVQVNPKLYPLEAVYSAAYVFLDRAYVMLDGDPKKEVFVKLKPKNKENLEKLGGEFLNELINYADYNKRAKETKQIREMLLQRVMITNDPSILQNDKEFDELLKETEEDDGYIDDPEGIAIPWEEKYGKKAKKQKNKIKKKKKK